MPTGIVLSTGSIGSNPEDSVAVLEKHGYEVPKPGDSKPAPKAPEPASQSDPVTLQEHYGKYLVAVENFREHHPNWDAVVRSSLPIHRAIYEAIIEAENPAITYHLGKDRDFTEKLARMKPAEAVREIRKLAERLKPEEGVRYKGTTMLRSGNRTEPAPPPAPKSAAAAAARGDYKAFKAIQIQRRGRCGRV